MKQQGSWPMGQINWPTATAKPNRVDGKQYGSLLPSCLRAGMESVAGISLARVRVHYNSPLPAKVQAHAYAQGGDIYLGPGQEHHLPHELGHVVQQALGMVKPNTTVNGMAVNDDPKLEQHATELGEKAIEQGGC